MPGPADALDTRRFSPETGISVRGTLPLAKAELGMPTQRL